MRFSFLPSVYRSASRPVSLIVPKILAGQNESHTLASIDSCRSSSEMNGGDVFKNKASSDNNQKWGNDT